MGQESYMRWSRTQSLKMGSALSRRYEYKYSEGPYNLDRMRSDLYSADEKVATFQDASSRRRCCVDTYTEGWRRMFPTLEEALSPKSLATIDSSFAALVIASDICERINAEVSAAKPSRAGSRDFSHFARESLLKQLRSVHLHRKGSDPLKPEGVKAPLCPAEVATSPLFLPPVFESIRVAQHPPI